MNPTHIAYADETNYNRGRFPGIAIVSLAKNDMTQVSSDIANILQQAKVTEFKWEKLSSAKRRFAAINLIDYTIKQATCKKLRVDVLTWDMQDGRHAIQKLDRLANLHRMYYHIFRNILRARWPDDAVWELRPDELSVMSWQEVHDYLDLHSINWIQASNNSEIDFQREFHIRKITPCRSHEEPLIQLADLFAGLGSYSRMRYGRFQTWQSNSTAPQLSHADRVRCPVINHLNKSCKKHRLGVSLQSHQGLRTLNPRQPINFWWYIPQHKEDIAPTR